MSMPFEKRVNISAIDGKKFFRAYFFLLYILSCSLKKILIFLFSGSQSTYRPDRNWNLMRLRSF